MANPTSNFGWQMPTNTDLVKDLPADFEVFGQAVDTSLADLKGGTTGQVLSKASNTDMDFSWTTSAGIQSTLLDAKGDLIVASAADTPARLAVGTNGYVLTADSAEANGVKWAALPGGGKILQVVSSQTTTEKTIGSATLTDTNLTATITPTSASSTILIIVSQPYAMNISAGTYNGTMVLVRGSTLIWNTLQRNNIRIIDDSNLTDHRDLAAFHYVDSPATTSATTYKTQVSSGTGSLTLQNTSHPSNIVLLEIGA